MQNRIELQRPKNKYTSFLIRYQPGTAKDLPLVSPFAFEALRALKRSANDLRAISSAFLTDPFLAAKLCGVANSIFFNLEHRHVLTIPEAIDRVGIDYASNLLLNAPTSALGESTAEATEYWAHCMTVSYATREISALGSSSEWTPEAAAFLGLIHDIGYLVELHYNPQFMPDVLAAIRGNERSPDNQTHCSLGESLSAFWSLPSVVQDALRAHHDLERATSVNGRRLAHLLRLADRVALQAPLTEAQDEDAIRLLGLNRSDLDALYPKASDIHRGFMDGTARL
jgi:HD-like signal output (HDOD) protein